MNRALVWVYLAMCVLRALTQVRNTPAHLTVLDVVIWVMFLYIMFRMFSKNLNRRREENRKFVGWLWKVKNGAAASQARRADKEHKYFTCKCGAVCRVPVGKGKVQITCPKCGTHFNAKT